MFGNFGRFLPQTPVLGNEASLQGAVEVKHCLVTVYPEGKWGHCDDICTNLHEFARTFNCFQKVFNDAQ